MESSPNWHRLYQISHNLFPKSLLMTNFVTGVILLLWDLLLGKIHLATQFLYTCRSWKLLKKCFGTDRSRSWRSFFLGQV